MSRRSCGIVRTLTLAGLVALTGGQARAADSLLGAHVGARIVQSDNLTLAPVDGASGRADDVSTGINFSRTQTRIDTHVNYSLEGVFYDGNSAANSVYHQLDARAQLTVAPERLFVDIFGIYDQTIIDPAGVFSFGNVTVSDNRTDVAILGVAPTLSLDFGDRLRGALRFSRSEIDYAEPRLLDRSETVGSFSIGSADTRRGGTWNVEYDQQRFDYDPFLPVEFEFFTVDLGYWVTSTLRLFTTQGLESDYGAIQSGAPDAGTLDHHFWYIGAEWRPNERANVELSVGERSFGRSSSLSAGYRTRNGRLSMSYSEQPSTFGRDQVLIGRQSGELAPIDALDGPAGDLFYLNKRWDVAYMLQRAKSSVGFRYFDDRRFDATTVTKAFGAETEHYRGTEFTLVWDVTLRWAMTASAQFAERKSTLSLIDDDLDTFSVVFGRQLGRTSQLSFGVARQSAEPKSEDTVVNRWTENQLTVAFRRGFGANSAGAVAARYSGFVDANRR